jgi:L-alanine-DL-glutamate epimerase-like enolase superfamily enzyme
MLTTRACRLFEAPFPADDFRDDIAPPPALVDGFVTAPEAPGLGHGVEMADLERRLDPIVGVSL